MATSTVLTNKPINPRGDDNRPVDSYNRASLYSGKALDFDGVNDYVDLAGLTFSGNNQSFCFYLKADAWNNFDYIFDIFSNRFIIGSQPANNLSIYDGASWQSFGEIDDTINTNFFVVTIEGTTSKAYLNGVQFGSNLTIALRDFSAANECALMSQYDGVQQFFPGKMSGFKAFEVALTATQVADLYNNPEKVVPTGVDNTALKLWLPMMEGAGTTAYDGAPDALGSELVTNGNFETNSDWTLASGSTIGGGSLNIVSAPYNANTRQTISLTSGKTYIVNINATATGSSNDNTFQLGFGDSAGNPSSATQHEFAPGTSTKSLFITASATDATIVFRSRDAGTSDLSVHSVSVKEITGVGTINGATWTHGIGAPVAQTAVINWNKVSDGTNEVLIPQGLTSGRDLLGNLFENVRKQGALNLDGNSWAEVHDNASLDFGTGSFTLEAWVKGKYVNQGSVFNVIISLGGNITSTNNAGLMVLNNVVPYFLYSNIASSGSSQTEGDWIHMVGTYDETNTTLYVNGVQVDQDQRTAADMTNGFVKVIGRDGTDPNRYYQDQIAQPRIYNRALTASEVLNNFNATKAQYQ